MSKQKHTPGLLTHRRSKPELPDGMILFAEMYDIHGNPTHLDSLIDEGNPYYKDDEPDYYCENCGDHGCYLCDPDIPKRKGQR